MYRYVLPLVAALAVSGCGGDPFDDEDPGEPPANGLPEPEPTDPDGPPPTGLPDATPEVLRNNVNRIVYDADSELFQIEILGLDTTPVLATWGRNANLDVAGYQAYSIQEDPLDRMFIGLAAQAGDGSVRAAVGGDGGQFNTFFSGATYAREGGFTPPTSTPDPGTGQVSYAGDYAGLTNISAPRNGEILDVPAGTPSELVPGQASRVSGEIFLNANFSDNSVNGAIYNRVLVDYNFGLESVVLVPTAIAADGTFLGGAERPIEADPNRSQIGDYGGIFGGANAGNVAGVVALERLHDLSGGEISNALERGIFVLRQCGMPGDAAICSDVLP